MQIYDNFFNFLKILGSQIKDYSILLFKHKNILHKTVRKSIITDYY